MKCAVCGTKKGLEIVEVKENIYLTDKDNYIWKVTKRPECKKCRSKDD